MLARCQEVVGGGLSLEMKWSGNRPIFVRKSAKSLVGAELWRTVHFYQNGSLLFQVNNTYFFFKFICLMPE